MGDWQRAGGGGQRGQRFIQQRVAGRFAAEDDDLLRVAVDALGKGQISQQSAGQRILQSHDGHRSQIAGGIVKGEQKHFFDQRQWRAGRRGN